MKDLQPTQNSASTAEGPISQTFHIKDVLRDAYLSRDRDGQEELTSKIYVTEHFVSQLHRIVALLHDVQVSLFNPGLIMSDHLHSGYWQLLKSYV